MVRIESESSPGVFYEVTQNFCTCPHYRHRMAKIGGQCKHMKKLFSKEEQIKDVEKEIGDVDWRNDFRNGGMDMDEAHNKYSDIKIKLWLETGEIFKTKNNKFLLLE